MREEEAVALLQLPELPPDDGGEGAAQDGPGHAVLGQPGREEVDVRGVVVDAAGGGPAGFDSQVVMNY